MGAIKKDTYCVIPIIWHSVKGKVMAPLKGLVLARVWGEGGVKEWSTEATVYDTTNTL